MGAQCTLPDNIVQENYKKSFDYQILAYSTNYKEIAR